MSEQDQPAFTAFHTPFTADECLPIIINKQNEHPHFFQPDKITKQILNLISFEPRLNTENNLLDDNRPYCYEQKIHEQQILFINFDYYNEDDNSNEEYIVENQNENRNEDIVHNMNDHKASEYTTPESASSAQNASQTETPNTQFVRVPTRFVNPRQHTHDPQLYETVQDDTHSIRDSSVYVLPPTRTFPNNTRNITRSRYDQFLVLSNSQIQQSSQKTILIIFNKFPVDTMIHLTTPVFHKQIQIFK